MTYPKPHDVHPRSHRGLAPRSRAGAALGVALLALSLTVPADAQTALFSDVTTNFGLESYDASSESHGPGAIFADVDCDGFADLYVVRKNQPNELWLNVDSGGQRSFQKVDGGSGAADAGPGQGAVTADYDNDGDADIYLLNWRGPNVLFKNVWQETEGNCAGTDPPSCFQDVTATTDPTGDDATDLQNGVGMPRHDNLEEPGFNSDGGGAYDELDNSMTAAWADVDRDGDLDLFVGNHDGQCGDPSSANDPELGERDTLFLNLGDGTFWDVTMAPPPGSTVSASAWQAVTGFEAYDGRCCFTDAAQLVIQPGCLNGGAPCSVCGTCWVPLEYNSTNAAAFSDFNNDGWMDLFVTNKAGTPANRDLLYVNRGRNAAGDWLGFDNVTYEILTCFGAGIRADMGVVTGDLDHDGDLEAYSSLGSDNNVWVNKLVENGDLEFVSDRTTFSADFSWGVNFADFDNNGWLDVHVATKCARRDYLYLQNGPFSHAEEAFNAGVSQSVSNDDDDNNPDSRGNPTADYDRDGWVDLFVVNRGSTCFPETSKCKDDPRSSALFHNDSKTRTENADHHYLTLHLLGDPSLPGHFHSSSDAIGARMRVRADLDQSGTLTSEETLLRDLLSGTGNAASTSALDLHFGVGQADEVFLQIEWPSGRLNEARVLPDAFFNAAEAALSVDAHWKFDSDLLDVTARHDGSQLVCGPEPQPAPPFHQEAVPGEVLPEPPSYADGALGRALSLDGTYGVSVPSTPHINQTQVSQRTISLWFRANQVMTGDKQVLYEEGGGTRGLNVYLDEGSLYAGGWNHDAAQGQWQAWLQIPNIQAQQWYHFVLYFDAPSGLQFGFLDGVPVAFAAAATVFDHGSNVRIGKNGNTFFHDTPAGTTETADLPFVGRIDDVRIYNRLLLADEILGMFMFGNL